MISERIAKLKADFYRDLLILGHHYQVDNVLQFADIIGDSYELSKEAAQSSRKYIIFCGVRFMAESADILTNESQAVYMPDIDAGCPMADMAEINQVEIAWEQLSELYGRNLDVVPVTYVNSSAQVKAWCGRNNGTTCTSSNATDALKWAFDRGGRVFFLPDRNLGYNSALSYGIKPDEIILWERNMPLGGNDRPDIIRAKIILWDGHCHVHTRFDVESLKHIRAENPDAIVIVHPECSPELVKMSDMTGSTSKIIKVVENLPAASTVYVGTEINLVNRLAAKNLDKKILPLVSSTCHNMAKTDITNLANLLEELKAGTAEPKRIRLPQQIKTDARKALTSMLDIMKGKVEAYESD